jgi:hypothetical protein
MGRNREQHLKVLFFRRSRSRFLNARAKELAIKSRSMRNRERSSVCSTLSPGLERGKQCLGGTGFTQKDFDSESVQAIFFGLILKTLAVVQIIYSSGLVDLQGRKRPRVKCALA